MKNIFRPNNYLFLEFNNIIVFFIDTLWYTLLKSECIQLSCSILLSSVLWSMYLYQQ